MAKLNEKERGYAALGGIIIAVVVVIVMIITNINKPSEEPGMSIGEAQKKCVVITMVGYEKATGEKQNVDDAQKHCLAMWDSPQREKDFIEYVTKEWNNNKDEDFKGQTIEKYYNDIKDTL